MTSCETKFKPESKVSGISLLNLGEGFVAVKNEDGPTLPNASGVITGSKENNNNTNNNDDIIEKSELTMLRLFYLGGISFVGLYLFYRIMSKYNR